MSELRRDPVMGRWVIIAPERARRPEQTAQPQGERRAGPCVFCEGQEANDPTEIFAVRDPGTAPNTPGWRVRVLPNKFPVLRIEGKLEREGVGMFDKLSGVGAHEVVVETPNHDSGVGRSAREATSPMSSAPIAIGWPTWAGMIASSMC